MTASKKNVLIVEDEKAISNALRLKLEFEGFTVVTASTGRECVDLCAEHAFLVVLLDLMMPVMDGFQALEQLHQMSRPPIVFVLSNLSQPEDEKRALELGAQKFFTKSNISLSKIVEEIKML